MGKVKREVRCYQSPTGERPPRCRQLSANLCGACSSALEHYNRVSAARQETRRRKNRESARLSRMRQEDRFSDLMAENVALGLEHEGLEEELSKTSKANKALTEAIYAKVGEMLAISFASGRE